MQEIILRETKHPDPSAQQVYDSLFGIDEIKRDLLETVTMILDPSRVASWQRKHHPSPPPLLARAIESERLVILSGDVGCGKTALAGCIGTPIAKRLGTLILSLETPSNIRGHGLVGGLSARITAAFEQASARAQSRKTILIIDEGDDLATSRAQMQAHHEDRAGVNVLVKQIDQVTREQLELAVILITNRPGVLDTAVLRRAAVRLQFHRPDQEARKHLFAHLMGTTHASPREIDRLVAASERDGLAFTYSDITRRTLQRAVQRAIACDEPVSTSLLLEALQAIEPTPQQD
jgi:SpoVK/Ycf46/Vps4 family AAA+-type ATPase